MTVAAAVSEASELPGKGGIAPALRRWHRALKKGNHDALRKIGDLYAKQGNFALAKAYWRRAKITCHDCRAAASYAALYLTGNGVVRNDRLGTKLLLEALEMGNTEPHNLGWIGYCFLYGNHLPRQVERGLALLERAAAAGEKEAAFELANYYCMETDGEPEALEHARTLYTKLAKQGDAKAIFRLGYLAHLLNRPDEMLRRYRQAARRGIAIAAVNLGNIYLYASDGQRRAPARALRWFREAVRLGFDDPEANLHHHMAYTFALLGRHEKEEEQELLRGQKLGEIESIRMLAYRQESARDSDPAAPHRAFLMLKPLAEQGDANAWFDLARYALEGWQLPPGKGRPDPALALTCLKNSYAAGRQDVAYAIGYTAQYDLGDYPTARAWFRTALRLNPEDARSLYQLGILYWEALGVRWSITRASRFLNRALALGNRQALSPLAAIARFRGDHARSFALLQDFVRDNGHFAPAWFFLGWHCLFGNGTEENIPQAVRYLKRAADGGDPDASFLLGKLALFGKGSVRPDARRALYWLELAGSRGSVEALDLLSHARVGAWGGIRKDLRQGRAEAEKVVEWRGTGADHFSAGCTWFFYAPKNDRKAYEHFLAAYQLGDLRSAENLGICFLEGRGTAADPKKAVRLFRELGASCPDALNQLGFCYEHALGVPRSLRRAFACYEQAVRVLTDFDPAGLPAGCDSGCRECTARQDGTGSANSSLAKAYGDWGRVLLFGIGTAADPGAAVTALRISARNGSILAAWLLGRCYDEGLAGIRRNGPAARAWYARALTHPVPSEGNDSVLLMKEYRAARAFARKRLTMLAR